MPTQQDQASSPRKLSQLTPWLGLACALLMLAGVIAYNLYQDYRNIDLLERQRLSLSTAILEGNLSKGLQSTSNALDSIREDQAWLLAQPNGRQLLNRRLTMMAASSLGVRSFLVVDAQGNVVASNRKGMIGMNFMDIERFRRILEQGDPQKLYISPPFSSPASSTGLSLGKMIPDSHGNFAGYVLAVLDTEYFRQLTSSSIYAEDMIISILLHNGRLVFGYPEWASQANQALRASTDSLFSEYQRSEQETLVIERHSDATDDNLLAIVTSVSPEVTIPDKPLTLIVRRSYDALYEPWRTTAREQSLALAGFAVLAILVMSIYQRRQQSYASQLARMDAERAQAVAQLQASERLWRQALEGGGHAVWDWDIPSGKLYFSSRFKEILGYSDDGIRDSYRELIERIHPEDAAALQRAHKLHFRGKTPFYHAQFRLRHKEGHYVRIESRGMLVERTAKGEPKRMVGTHTDITDRRAIEDQLRSVTEALRKEVEERKQIEARLSESEQRWRQALDGAGHGVWDWHVPTGKVELSNTWKSMLGYEEHEVGNDIAEWTQRLHPDDLPTTMRNLWAYLNSAGGPYTNIHRLRCKDGSWKWVLARGITLERDQDGKPVRILGTQTDITPQKTAEEQLRQSEERLRLALEAAGMSTWHWDLSLNRLSGPDLQRLLRGQPGEAQFGYEDWLAAIHPDYRKRVERAIHHAMSTRSVFSAEFPVIWPDGSEHWVSALGRFYHDADGAVQHLEGVIGCSQIAKTTPPAYSPSPY